MLQRFWVVGGRKVAPEGEKTKVQQATRCVVENKTTLTGPRNKNGRRKWRVINY